jgi:hypothetical protein
MSPDTPGHLGDAAISLLPLDLTRWDQATAGDLFAVPVTTDVRPLRGPAGLLDWRLNGRLSSCLREERFRGEPGEKLLMPTQRVPWSAILAIGIGAAAEFDEGRFRLALAVVLATARGLVPGGQHRLAIALPGRDLGRLEPERAVTLLREVLASAHPAPSALTLTLVDTAAALKTMGALVGVSPGVPPAASRAERP